MKKLGVNSRNSHIFNKIFHFDKRLRAEQKTIDNSSAIIVSTKEELKNQYKGYKIKKHINH